MAIKHDPRLADAYFWRGQVCYHHTKDLSAAKANFMRFLKLSPNHPYSNRVRKQLGDLARQEAR